MTLQEAKDEIAQKYSHDAWDWKFYENGPEFMENAFNEVAELYGKSKWYEACEAQKEVIAEEGLLALLKFKPEFKK